MAHIIDKTMIQFRMLNKSRGPAVQAPRSQADKLAYAELARQTIEKQENLDTLQDTVVGIEVEEITNEDNSSRKKLTALITERGRKIPRVSKGCQTTYLVGRQYYDICDCSILFDGGVPIYAMGCSRICYWVVFYQTFCAQDGTRASTCCTKSRKLLTP